MTGVTSGDDVTALRNKGQNKRDTGQVFYGASFSPSEDPRCRASRPSESDVSIALCMYAHILREMEINHSELARCRDAGAKRG